MIANAAEKVIPSCITIENFKALRIWCVWKRNQDKKKIPRDPLSGRYLKWKEPSNLISFKEAKKALDDGDFEGLGFVLPAKYFLIDLDHAYKDGTLNTSASKLVASLDSYTEISPSSNGIHIIIKGSVSCNRNITIIHDNQKIEVKKPGTFITYTGNIISKNIQIEDRSKFLKWIYDKEANSENQCIKLPTVKKPAGKYGSNSRVTSPSAYCMAALRAECEKVRSAPKGRRNEALNTAAFKIGRFIGNGISESTAMNELLNAARFSGLSDDEAVPTIRRALRDGNRRRIKRG